MFFYVTADMGQCPLSNMVIAPHIQNAAFTLGLRSIVFDHDGSTRLIHPTGWADAAGWAYTAGYDDAAGKESKECKECKVAHASAPVGK